MPMTYAIVTPSYGPDFERCQLLCRSIDRHVSGPFHHYLIVDTRDRRRFLELSGPRTTVLAVESVLPRWIFRLPMARRWWFSLKTPPVRNWILQQAVKLSVGEFLREDAFVFIDSDVAFLRPFSVDAPERDGLLRLFRVPGAARQATHIPWHQTAARLLGLPATDYFGSTYIGNLICWRRDALRRMYRHIEDVSGRPWLETVLRQWHLSEYILYGVFAEHVLGEESGHYHTPIPLCHISWDYALETDADLDRFFGEVWPEHVAAMVSSKQGLPVSRYVRYFEAEAASHPAVPREEVPCPSGR